MKLKKLLFYLLAFSLLISPRSNPIKDAPEDNDELITNIFTIRPSRYPDTF